LYETIRPLLFRLPPERAHALTLALLGLAGAAAPARALLRAAFRPRRGRPVEAFGLRFPNAVGLAAGFDKDGVAWRGLACLGFGHLELGTVTPRPQPGNPAPRVFRLVEDRALINRLGFPGGGAEAAARRLAGARRPGGVVLGVNLGRQRDTPPERAADDYEALLARFAPLADYLTINVSSPNTPGLRDLERGTRLASLLARLIARRDALGADLGRRVPLLVKLSPDLTETELAETLEAIEGCGADGVVATNTSTAREGLRSPRAAEAGGLSGAALSARSLRLLRAIVARTSGRLPVIACGGVAGVADARARLDAGACLVQVYTGLVYEGPGLARRLVEGLVT